MAEGEMLKLSVEEFSRIQDYMVSSEKDSDAYKKMKRRYIELGSLWEVMPSFLPPSFGTRALSLPPVSIQAL